MCYISKVKQKSTPNKSTPIPSIGQKEKQHYQQEIRKLLQQVNEQDKKMHGKVQVSLSTISILYSHVHLYHLLDLPKQELQKLESKLTILKKDKSNLGTHITTLEKQVSDLNLKNSFLSSQVRLYSIKCV